jgi:ABC-type branched-subunit amino acid transport system substrate-binding protein
MTARIRQILGTTTVIAAVLALGVTACSSSDDSDTATDTGADGTSASTTGTGPAADPGPTTGLTDTSMHLSVIVPDFGGLVEAGFAPDLGDAEAQIQAYVDYVNDNGGIAGRQIETSYHTFTVPATQQDLRATCLEATQDEQAFVVIGAAALPPEGSLCVAGENRTPIITQAGLTPSIYADTEGRVFTTGMAWDRVRRGWVQALDDRGDLEGRTIGIVTDDADRFRGEAINEGLVPQLVERGYDVAERIVLPCEEGTTNCSQYDTAVTSMQSAGVDFIFLDAGATSTPAFLSAAEAVGYDPEYTLVDQSVNKTVAQFLEPVAEYIDGTLAVSYFEASGVRNQPGDDAFSFAANNCANIRILKAAAESLDEGELGQTSLVTAIESLPSEEVVGFHVLDGSFAPDKHDATDYVIVRRYDAASLSFPQEEGEDWRAVD